jgi:hypothetical protein
MSPIAELCSASASTNWRGWKRTPEVPRPQKLDILCVAFVPLSPVAPASACVRIEASLRGATFQLQPWAGSRVRVVVSAVTSPQRWPPARWLSTGDAVDDVSGLWLGNPAEAFPDYQERTAEYGDVESYGNQDSSADKDVPANILENRDHRIRQHLLISPSADRGPRLPYATDRNLLGGWPPR